MTAPTLPLDVLHLMEREGWGERPDLTSPPAPPFPLDALPPELRELTTAVATFVQVDPGAVATPCLGILSTAAQGAFTVTVRGDYREPVNIYALLAMESGDRKSEIFARLRVPIDAYEQQQREAKREERAIAMAQKSRLERERKREERKPQPNDARLAELAVEIANVHVPPEPRLSVDDCTMEKLGVLLADHGGVTAVLAPEGGLFGITGGRYTNGVASIEPLLRGYSGETLRVDRVTRDFVLVPRAILSIAMAVQPMVLREFVGHTVYRGRGLVARFLMAQPRSTIGTRIGEPPEIPPELLAGWSATVTALLARSRRGDTPGDLSLSAEAYREYRRFYVEIEGAQGPGGRLADLRDWGSKAAGQVVRLAALLHLYRYAQSDPLPVVITGETMQRAVKLGEFFTASAITAIQPESPLWRDLRRLADWLRLEPRAIVSLREIKQRFRSGERQGDDWLEVTREAEEVGLLWNADASTEQTPAGRTNRARRPGRPPSPTWIVHPAYRLR